MNNFTTDRRWPIISSFLDMKKVYEFEDAIRAGFGYIEAHDVGRQWFGSFGDKLDPVELAYLICELHEARLLGTEECA